jgi:hypothetical protein
MLLHNSCTTLVLELCFLDKNRCTVGFRISPTKSTVEMSQKTKLAGELCTKVKT